MMFAFFYWMNAGICLLNFACFIALGSPLNFVVALACGVSWSQAYAERASELLLQDGGST